MGAMTKCTEAVQSTGKASGTVNIN